MVVVVVYFIANLVLNLSIKEIWNYG